MPGFDFQALAARARADNPDAVLLDAIEQDKTRTRRFNRAMASCKGEPRAELRHRLASEIMEDRDRIAAARPASLEGLLAKLRHAAAKSKGVGLYAVQFAALTDAIEWLDPPKPANRKTRARKRAGGQAPEAA